MSARRSPTWHAGAVQPLVDRRADQPRRCSGPCGDRAGGRADRRGDRRALPEPDHLQAAVAGRCDPLLPDRWLPAWRRQRGAGGAADGGEVRRAGLPACRRRRPVRVRAAPVDLRLRLRQRFAGAAAPRVCRSPARAFRRPGADEERPLHAAGAAGLQHHDEARSLERARVSERTRLEGLRMIKTIIFDLGKVIVPFDFQRGYDRMAPLCRYSPAEIPERLRGCDLVTSFEEGKIDPEAFVSN